jgi:hypothetical protein
LDGDLMKVAICFIGTGKYLNFLPKYYENIQEYFLLGVEKTFLVFTDGEGDFPEDVKVYHQEHLEWPYITLKRFEIIQKAKEEIEKNDWFVFIDADALVVDAINKEEFFDETKPFFGVHHPCHFLQMPPHNEYPGAFETNPLSLSHITKTDNLSVYYQGCLWGGKVPDVLELIDELNSRVDKDLENNVIAVWHDESHLNKFFIERKESVHTLGPEFAYPEVFSEYCNFSKKIVHLSKDNSKYHY